MCEPIVPVVQQAPSDLVAQFGWRYTFRYRLQDSVPGRLTETLSTELTLFQLSVDLFIPVRLLRSRRFAQIGYTSTQYGAHRLGMLATSMYTPYLYQVSGAVRHATLHYGACLQLHVTFTGMLAFGLQTRNMACVGTT
ncbi:hypothetical protein BaRGS_00015750 [Batillaria attramentaria]|uniref:Uncharacterized protein n=1 Tax=Batillaria attramentaria TaxID=370345 RepID=A0ABD0L0W0_9CAEN